MAKSKTAWAQLKIGLVAILALTILGVLVVLMSGTNPLFKQTSPVYVFFDDSFAMTPGATPVRLNGILIGKVGSIDLSGSNEVNRAVKVTLNAFSPLTKEAGSGDCVTVRFPEQVSLGDTRAV